MNQIRDALLQCAGVLYRDRRACQCSGQMSGPCIKCTSRQAAENSAHGAIEALDSAPPAFPPEVMEAAREALRLDEKATRDWATEDADNEHLITRGKSRSGAFRYVADFSFSDKEAADRRFALGARELLPMLARAILARAPTCPHALTTSRLADGEFAPDEAKAAREHVAGCRACRETVGQLAALADASNR